MIPKGFIFGGAKIAKNRGKRRRAAVRFSTMPPLVMA